MDAVYVDASPLAALVNRKDQNHSVARNLLKQLQTEKIPLITTDYIIDEATTLLLTRSRNGYHFALAMLNWALEQQTNIRIHWINKTVFIAAVRIFRRYNKDKLWSFTDCTSFVVMKELGVKTAFTFDKHFKQMGFKLLGE